MHPISLSITDAARAIGVGRTTLYKFINSGELETSKLGSRTLVKTESLHRLLAQGGQ